MLGCLVYAAQEHADSTPRLQETNPWAESLVSSLGARGGLLGLLFELPEACACLQSAPRSHASTPELPHEKVQSHRLTSHQKSVCWFSLDLADIALTGFRRTSADHMPPEHSWKLEIQSSCTSQELLSKRLPQVQLQISFMPPTSSLNPMWNVCRSVQPYPKQVLKLPSFFHNGGLTITHHSCAHKGSRTSTNMEVHMSTQKSSYSKQLLHAL